MGVILFLNSPVRPKRKKKRLAKLYDDYDD